MVDYMNNMRKTSCKAQMKFIDVTALEDATVITADNQSIGDTEGFKIDAEQKDYGTFELNQFVLDGRVMELAVACISFCVICKAAGLGGIVRVCGVPSLDVSSEK